MNQKIALIFFLLFSPLLASAQNTGLGIILGEPTGISANFRLSEEKSIDAALGFSFIDDNHVYLHSTYLWHNRRSLKLADNEYLGWYGGIGGRLRVYDNGYDDRVYLGPRTAIGLNYEFNKIPLEIFTELSLHLDIIPRTDADLGAAIGVRYYL